VSKRDIQQAIRELKEKREREMLDRFGQEIRPTNGQGQQGPPPMPFPVMSQGFFLCPPATKLCWDIYFATIQQHFRQGMSRDEREQLADDAMAMAITACARIGAKIDDEPPADWRKGEESMPFGQPGPGLPED
jgi:hypothetical protein